MATYHLNPPRAYTAYPVHDSPCGPSWEAFGYHTLHIPSGRTAKAVRYFRNGTHFLECLDMWNGVQPTTWKYWSAKP